MSKEKLSKDMDREIKKRYILNIVVPILAVLLALIIGGIIILCRGGNPIEAYTALFVGAFSNERNIAKTFLEATPLIFAGLSVLIAFKGGMFNIGTQGQMMMAGITAGILGGVLPNLVETNVIASSPLYSILSNIYVMFIICGAVGFFWAVIAGYLKAKFGVHEVISTIMLNYIALNFEQYCLNNNTLVPGGNAQTPAVVESARFGKLLDINVTLNYGFIISLIAVALVWFIFNKTTLGYKIRAVGSNPTAAENNGINVKLIMWLTLGISGFIAGIGGLERVAGGVGQYSYKGGLIATYGFDGIAVALLGKNNPVGALLASILFAALRIGGRAMQLKTNVPSEMVIMIQAIIILLIAAENMIRSWLEKSSKGGKK